VAEARGQFWNPKEGERPPLISSTGGLVTRWQIGKAQVRAVSTECALGFVIASCKCPINSFANPNTTSMITHYSDRANMLPSTWWKEIPVT
jgi:hypothetical protein